MEAHPAGTYLFRGQPERKPILPKIGRPEYHYDAARERQLHAAFRRASRPFITVPLSSEWEVLALAQHHGVPTRLVDWSTSPLVAAWFAVTSYPEAAEAAVYALELNRADLQTIDITTGKASSGGQFEHPLDVARDVHLIESAPVSARITTQRGIFTLHGDPTVALDVPASHTFPIPEPMRAEFQNRLHGLGIDASDIYPDLEGLAKTLDWKLKSGRGFSSIA